MSFGGVGVKGEGRSSGFVPDDHDPVFGEHVGNGGNPRYERTVCRMEQQIRSNAYYGADRKLRGFCGLRVDRDSIKVALLKQNVLTALVPSLTSEMVTVLDHLQSNAEIHTDYRVLVVFHGGFSRVSK